MAYMRQDVVLDTIRPETDADTEIRQEAESFKLGANIRKLRQRHSLTIRDVSDPSGLSKSLLRQIENETGAPPIPALIRIAMVLGVKIGCFFRDKSRNQHVSAVPKDARQEAMKLPHNRPEHSGYRYISPAHPLPDQHMEPFWVRTEPRYKTEGACYQHSGC